VGADGGGVVNVIENLREWSASSEEWSAMVREQEKFAHESFTGQSEEALQTGGRIADLLEAYADRMERSGLVSWVASSFTPEGLRADAAVWREGRDPHE
jgi:hypothetical protein